MSAHTCTSPTRGCYRCELNRDEVMAAFMEIENEAEAAWIKFRDRELRRGRKPRNLRRADFIAGFCLANDYDIDA